MRRLLGIVLVLLVASPAGAASYELTWQQEANPAADNTRIERAPATGNTCGTFAEIAQVPVTTLSYLDATAPAGLVCYQVRNARAITTPGGPVTEFSLYSNVAAAPRTKPPKFLVAP